MRFFNDNAKLVLCKYKTGFLHNLTCFFTIINFLQIISRIEPFAEKKWISADVAFLLYFKSLKYNDLYV